MIILDCCISLKIIRNNLVVLGVVDMRQFLLNGLGSRAIAQLIILDTIDDPHGT